MNQWEDGSHFAIVFIFKCTSKKTQTDGRTGEHACVHRHTLFKILAQKMIRLPVSLACTSSPIVSHGSLSTLHLHVAAPLASSSAATPHAQTHYQLAITLALVSPLPPPNESSWRRGITEATATAALNKELLPATNNPNMNLMRSNESVRLPFPPLSGKLIKQYCERVWKRSQAADEAP